MVKKIVVGERIEYENGNGLHFREYYREKGIKGLVAYVPESLR